jgi:hypothetical protein
MKRLALGILAVGLVLAPAVSASASASASAAGASRPAGAVGLASCVGQSLQVFPLSGQTLVDTEISNDCGVPVPLKIRYRAFGPCPHRSTVEVTVQPGSWSVSTFYRGPCPGSYTLDQRVETGGDLVGTDSTTFAAT